jgi:lantibiotic modifying enzyme
MTTYHREGDSHRFGQRVKETQLGDGRAFIKPRSVLLEQMFLDRSIVRNQLSRFLPYSSILKVQSESTWNGTVSALDGDSHLDPNWANNSEIYAKRCGNLLAVTTLLGLVDLHHENILIVQDRNGDPEPTPIDIEIAFWDCISAIDTNLIPSSLTEPKIAGFKGQLSQSFCPKYPQAILDGFLDTSAQLKTIIGDILETMERELKGHPIRVLLRATRDYRVLMSGNLNRNTSRCAELLSRPGIDLIDEEIEQLRAGDIPYFFTLREKNPQLYYFSKPGEISRCEPRHFEAVFRNASKPVSLLADLNRIQRLTTISALHIYKSFQSFWPKRCFEGENFSLERQGEKFFLRTPWFQAGATLA